MKKYEHNGTTYFISGDNPKLLICSGIHGDEYGVVRSVRAFLEAHAAVLPPFVYIPEISASAIALGTRANQDGDDLNRCFLDDTASAEARATMDIVRQCGCMVCFSFHEDPEHGAFYMYDNKTLPADVLHEFRECVTKTGIALFTGIDDAGDDLLGHEIEDGYKGDVDSSEHPGPFESWLIESAGFSRVFGIEVPGSAPQETKDRIAATVCRCLVSHSSDFAD